MENRTFSVEERILYYEDRLFSAREKLANLYQITSGVVDERIEYAENDIFYIRQRLGALYMKIPVQKP